MKCHSLHCWCRIALLATVLVVLRTAQIQAEPTEVIPQDVVSFSRDIRPLFSENCFRCHGPDEDERQSDFRLDTPHAADESVIVGGKPDESELWLRISSDDPDVKMPPPESGKKLAQSQIDLVRQWIDQGASWAGHWAFVPLERPQIPSVSGPSWGTNPIDRFVLAKLQSQGWEPSPAASKAALIRRVTLDLHGLPPTMEEVAAFVADQRGDAFERVVDRLLASPRFGERMALAWMDAARYGDTSVMHGDGPRTMWPWRDWVIRSYNHNLPFDQFLTEQLAGDLLEQPTRDQLIATGFNRNNASSDEGGAIPEELRVEYTVDRLKTTFNVFQGLAIECAQCHSHKYDPISQHEYYAAYAFFNNATDPGFQVRTGNQSPKLPLPDPKLEQSILTLDSQLEQLDRESAAAEPPRELVAAWIETATSLANDAPTVGPWYLLGPFSGGTIEEVMGIEFFRPSPGPPNLDEWVEDASWQLAEDWPDGRALPLQMHRHSAYYLFCEVTTSRAGAYTMQIDGMDELKAWVNGELVVEQRPKPLVEEPQKEKTPQEPQEVNFRAGKNYLILEVFCQSDRMVPLVFRMPTSFPSRVAESLRTATRDSEDALRLSRYFHDEVWEVVQKLKDRREILLASRSQLLASAPTTMVMQERVLRRPTYLLSRGQYDSPVTDEEILPDVPAALPPLPPGSPRNRLGLAQWMVDPSHPLTARVAVNRYWAMLMGDGLVRTVMDFGSQGSPPTHPELLDWLASDFVDSDWNIKRKIKQIVTSATYRQSSRATPEHLANDPENQLWARAPRFRLQGELIRDTALALSGQLQSRIGGPSVKPYQPPGLWNEVSIEKTLEFEQDHGDNLYRRSLYIYWKRSAPPPSMSIFDAPTREKCEVQRTRTNTPLQALVTLNDVQFVEASRHLAERILKAGGEDFDSRIDFAFRLCLARSPQADEIAVCRELFEQQFTSFQSDPGRAEEYLRVGESRRDESLDPIEHAVWTVLANTILNLDEVLTRG